MSSITTVVIDAGARYGVHPSWDRFGGELQYLAFEPDVDEARRLQEASTRDGVEVVNLALAGERGTRTLNITRHRGYCSFLEPDPEAEWFKRYRPGEGEIEKRVQIETDTIDNVLQQRGAAADFLKVDTEGTELEILQGAAGQLSSSVLGVRTSAYFQACYKGQPLFAEMHAYLSEKGFFLLNLDYVGRGVPRNSFFRNPDPLSVDSTRYGTLIGTDGVWLLDLNKRELNTIEALKYAAFAMLNFGPDVALDTLLAHCRVKGGPIDATLAGTRLFKTVRRMCAEFLGRYRVYPDRQWDEARETFQSIFGMELAGADKYWDMIRTL